MAQRGQVCVRWIQSVGERYRGRVVAYALVSLRNARLTPYLAAMGNSKSLWAYFDVAMAKQYR